ncbi:MAG: RNA methyltransferase [Myxococcales bacterium]|nr:RNA methyltransferase [Myxococcales bacterium]|tara:strand:+ start:1556 stop:2803 length:1248 start_codon:yes stop_codon:yes gene_type:complete
MAIGAKVTQKRSWMDPFRKARPIYITCDGGLEGVLARELETLGVPEAIPSHRGVGLFGNRQLLQRINVESRIANRILVPIAEYPADTRERLYGGARKVDWSRWFKVDATISIDASSHKSEHDHTGFIAQVIKDAICDHFRDKTGRRPSVDRLAPDIRINARIDRNHCVLSLDSSGDRLHRRGYRVEIGQAPIKETLAAGILALAGWQPGDVLIDPMCGSGTFLIEAAMIASNRAPGLDRARGQGFGFMNWLGFDAMAFEDYLTTLEERIIHEARPQIFGADNNRSVLEKMERNAERAQVAGLIETETCAVVDLRNPATEHADAAMHVISNPPYGERLKPEHLERLYRQLGDGLKSEFGGAIATLIVSEESPHRNLGLAPSKTRKLRNGAIPCRLLRFEVFKKGSFVTKSKRPARD